MAFRRGYLHVLGPRPQAQEPGPPYGDLPCRLGPMRPDNPNPHATDAESGLETGLQIRPCYSVGLGPGHINHIIRACLHWPFLQKKITSMCSVVEIVV